MRLKDKVTLITGAGAGIGQATAILFAREGAAVTVVDRSAETGHDTVQQITQEGGRAVFVQADVSQAASVQEMFRATIAAFGKLNILFNNAGTVAQGKVEETSEEEWETQIGTTLTSVYLGCKYGIPLLRQQGGGVIINMSSVAGVRGVRNRAVYSAAKGAVVARTHPYRARSGGGAQAVRGSPAYWPSRAAGRCGLCGALSRLRRGRLSHRLRTGGRWRYGDLISL
jgi:NAD(P)-dependent dehydrogenase (short-subunit alcohol dehydrogenase family)